MHTVQALYTEYVKSFTMYTVQTVCKQYVYSAGCINTLCIECALYTHHVYTVQAVYTLYVYILGCIHTVCRQCRLDTYSMLRVFAVYT